MIAFKISTHEIRTPTRSEKNHLEEAYEKVGERTANILIALYKEDFKRFQAAYNTYSFKG